MKSRSKELLDRAIAAMIAAIEIYNKPDFSYRAEAFAILALNAWELLLKAKWLADNDNKISTLYVMEPAIKKDGKKSKKMQIKRTRSNNPYTHSLDYIAERFLQDQTLDNQARENLKAMCDMRDSAIHFYDKSGAFPVRLQEVGVACLKNFVSSVHEWFDRDLSEYNFYLMPLSFFPLPASTTAIKLNREERNYIEYLNTLETEGSDPASDYSITVNIEFRYVRSKSKDAFPYRTTNDPNAPAMQLTEEDIRKRYPWTYDQLTKRCRSRYVDFKVDSKYHKLRKGLETDSRYGDIRLLDPGNPKSTKKIFFNSNILQELDKHYTKK